MAVTGIGMEMLPKIEIRTFGALQVVREGQAVTEGDWHTRQARQLLKILITERPRPVSTDRLIEILWPKSAPNAAATTLRSAINALRNVLEPNRLNRAPSHYIITQNPGYAFHRHPDIWLDVEVFETELDQAHRLPVGRERRARLEAAIELYTDDYLISDPYADWAREERDRLRERYFNALMELSELQAAEGAYAAAISACRLILARDEVRENAYQLLMRFQAESGDSASALLTYERCRTILAEELGADPSPLTQELHRRILNGEISLAAPDLLSHVAQTTAPPARDEHELAGRSRAPLPQAALLPAMGDSLMDIFVGREGELRQLMAALEEIQGGRGQLVILEGEAGIGKTRLAYALLQRAAKDGYTVISASCQRIERKFPFAPLADSIGRYLHSLPQAALESLPAASLGQMAQIIPSLQDLLPDLPLPVADGLSNPDEHRQRLIEGIVAFLAELARMRPLILFLDDLHWADADTLAVLSRLSQRLPDLPMLTLLAYRSGDLPENEALITLLHAFNRVQQDSLLPVPRLSQAAVRAYVDQFTDQDVHDGSELADFLYEATQGNPLFVSEALRDLQERYQAMQSQGSTEWTEDWFSQYQRVLSMRHNQRIREIIQERIDRLPDCALKVLQLCAVIGRDFSLDLLEAAASEDPLEGVEVLLERRFLLERADERLDFSHQIVRQAVYVRLNSLQRRRLHRQVANALIELGRARMNPGETAFHFSHAGAGAKPQYGHYSVLAAEQVLGSFGFHQAIEYFDNALAVLENLDDEDSADCIGRALQGRGLAYESLLDPDGVTDTYRRLHRWARQQNDLQLMLTANTRLASMLELVGQQRESNQMLLMLVDALRSNDVIVRSPTITDLLERRRRIYSPYETDDRNSWDAFIPPPPTPTAPVEDVRSLLEPVHAVMPLLAYGWTLRVQGQLDVASECLEAAIDLAMETGQRALASIAYFQLAVTARMQGDLERSQELNERSMALNRQGDATGELVSLWPRIASAFQSLHAGRLDEAERRLQRVTDFLDSSDAFRNHRNSARIGLGLVALGKGDVKRAKLLITEALADPINIYPYTHVQGLLGLANIAAREDDLTLSRSLLRRALRFAGQRSLIEEYVAVVLEIARLRPANAPVQPLLRESLDHLRRAGMIHAVARLEDALEDAQLETTAGQPSARLSARTEQ
jgi:DNA-binding SARP family transcriptional activator/Tfp pilus assembly protein PilF